MTTENQFEERAKRILTYLHKDVRHNNALLPRPFFLELTGSPSAGKTTTITELDKFFRRMGLRVLRPQEGAEVIRHIERDTPLYNLRTAMNALTQLVDYAAGHLYDVVIFDRCIFDAPVWMMYWREKSKLTEEEMVRYQQYFLSRFWVDQIDLAMFMVCDPEKAMGRELKIALSDKLGETTNPKTIKTLADRYRAAFAQLKPNYPQLELLDTTDLDEKTMVERVADLALAAIERRMST